MAATRVANELLLRPNASITSGVLAKLRQVVQGLETWVGVGDTKNVTVPPAPSTVGKKRRKRQTSLATGTQTPADAESVRSIVNLLGGVTDLNVSIFR